MDGRRAHIKYSTGKRERDTDREERTKPRMRVKENYKGDS